MSESPFASESEIGIADQRSGEPWPKISILDFMVWMSASALFLTLCDSDEFQGDVKYVFASQQIAYGIVAGAQLAALFAVFRSRRKSSEEGEFGRQVRQPGHWLLISPMAWLVVLIIGGVGRFLTGEELNSWTSYAGGPGNWILWVYFLGTVLVAIAWGFACKHFRGGWRLFYFLGVVVSVLSSATMLSTSTVMAMVDLISLISGVMSILNIGLIVVLLGLLFVERSVRRSWMHWVGVIGWLVTQLWSFLFSILWQFFQS